MYQRGQARIKQMGTNNFADKSQLSQQKLIQLLETGENEQSDQTIMCPLTLA
jgi:hypothetical protein